MSLDNKNLSIIPTGEAQVGKVQSPSLPTGEAHSGKVQSSPTSAPVDDSPTPVLEHEVQLAPTNKAPRPEPVAPTTDEETTTNEETQAAPEPESGLPESLMSQPVTCAAPTPLQESVPVPIPVRVNLLHTDHKRLRHDLDALEYALKNR